MDHGCPIFSACMLSSYCKTDEFKVICLPKSEVFKRNQQVNLKENRSTYIVVSGIGKVTFSLYNEICDLFLLGKGQMFGEAMPIMMENNNLPFEFWAINNLRVCKLSSLGLREYIKHNPVMMCELFKASGYNYTSSIQIRWVMNAFKVYDQILRLLMVLNKINDDETRAPLTLTHEEIALILQTDRTSVSLALEKLQKDKLVETGYRKIYIKDSVVYHELFEELNAICPKVAYYKLPL